MKAPPLLLLFLVASVPIVFGVLILAAYNVELLVWRPPLYWSLQFGITGFGGDNYVNSVAAGSSGIYVDGIVNETFANQTFSGQLFVRRYDTSSSLVWSHEQKNLGSDHYDALSTGNNGLYVLGRVNESLNFIKFDSSGNLLWTRKIGGPFDEPGSIFASSSATFVAGSLSSPITNQSYSGRVQFVREYDSNGNIVWTSEFSNSSGLRVAGVYATSSGVYIVTSSCCSNVSGFLVKYDLNGNLLWRVGTGGNGISGDGSNLYIAGSGGVFTKYGPDGNQEWTIQFQVQDKSGISYSRISADVSGEYLTAVSGSGNVYLLKYDAQGNQLWNFQALASRTSHVYLGGLAASPTDTYFAVGPNGVYYGGSVAQSSGSQLAMMEAYAKDGSFILFGLQPPWSLALVSGIGAAVALVIVSQIRRGRRLAKTRVKQSEGMIPRGIPRD